MLPELNPQRALAFRITHRDNLPWILDHGLHCRNSNKQDPNFISIGNQELIDKRKRWGVDHAMGGKLSDYIPFYFTPLSMMAFNIHTGHNGVRKRDGDEIVILVAALPRFNDLGVKFLFTDSHACCMSAQYSDDLSQLDRIDWKILQNRDFKRDNEDIGKTDRYQAEALVLGSINVDALLGIACYNSGQKVAVNRLVDDRGLDLKVFTKGGWYFR